MATIAEENAAMRRVEMFVEGEPIEGTLAALGADLQLAERVFGGVACYAITLDIAREMFSDQFEGEKKR